MGIHRDGKTDGVTNIQTMCLAMIKDLGNILIFILSHEGV